MKLREMKKRLNEACRQINREKMKPTQTHNKNAKLE